MIARVSVLASMALLAVGVSAHSIMLTRKMLFQDEPSSNGPFGRINSESFTYNPPIPGFRGMDQAEDAMKTPGTPTVRQFIMKFVRPNNLAITKECGNSVLTGPRQPLPDAVDFPWGHPGPCEVWCDNHRVLFNKDCQGNKVGNVTVDKEKCKGASIIQGLYVGTHTADWEIFANCAPIERGTGTDPTVVLKTDAPGGDVGPTKPTGTTATPATTAATVTTKPSPNPPSKTPASTPAPVATPATPKPAAPQPSNSSSSSKCTRRVRQ